MTASLRLQAAHWTRWWPIWISHFQIWQKRRVYWHQQPIVCVAFARHSVCRSGYASGGEKQGNGRVTHTHTLVLIRTRLDECLAAAPLPFENVQSIRHPWHFFFVASHISISDKVLTPNHPNIGCFCIAMGLAWTKHKQERECLFFGCEHRRAYRAHKHQNVSKDKSITFRAWLLGNNNSIRTSFGERLDQTDSTYAYNTNRKRAGRKRKNETRFLRSDFSTCIFNLLWALDFCFLWFCSVRCCWCFFSLLFVRRGIRLVWWNDRKWYLCQFDALCLGFW